MKSKNFKKKLTLNKKTIVSFEITEMRGIHGGIKLDHIEAPVIEWPRFTDGCNTLSGDPCMAC